MAYTSPWIDEELSILQDHVARFLQRELVPRPGDMGRAGIRRPRAPG